MKKPITLQYTIDESQLPSETARLLSNSLLRLTSIVASTPEAKDILSVRTVKEVGALRDELTSIDMMLGDVSSIVDQYIQYQNELRVAQQSGELEPPEEYEMPDMREVDVSNMDLDDLQTKISQLQQLQSSETASFEDAAEIVPGLTKKTVKVNSEENSQSDNLKIEEIQQQIEAVREFQSTATDVDEKDALSMLSDMNSFDFTDIANIGSQLQALQAKIGKKMKSPIKDLRFSPKSLAVLKELIPVGSKVDSYLLYSGDLEINLAEDGRHLVSHTTSFIIYDFWRSMFDNPDIILKAVDHFWPIEDQKLFDVYQTVFRGYKDHLVRAALFFILNRCSSEGMIQSGMFDPKNFNPIALTYIQRFKKHNFDVAWDKNEDFIDSIQVDTDADYLYFPVGKFSYNFFEDSMSRGFEETSVNHSALCEKVKKLDKKVILDYLYHPRLMQMYKKFPTKILFDEYGRITSDDQKAKEVLIANY